MMDLQLVQQPPRYETYDVRAIAFDGGTGAGVAHLPALLQEIAGYVDRHLKASAQSNVRDNTTYDVSVALTEDGLYTAMLYIFNDTVGDADDA